MAEEEAKAAEEVAEGDGAEVVVEDMDFDSISDIPVEISAVLGRCSMPVSQLLKLGRGAVVKLDKKVGEPIEIFVNNRLVAKGEVVLVENSIGITMTEIIRSESY